MLRFKQYLSEVVKTKRVGIEHMERLRPLDFIRIMKIFEDDFKGVLSTDKIQIREKMDGAGIRFGVSENGQFFLESSHSGPKFKIGSFSEFTRQKSGEADSISQGYDEVLERLRKWGALVNLLRQNLPHGGKIVGEMLYNPFGRVQGAGIKFIAINYDRSKLASWATFVLFDVLDSNGNSMPNKDKIINEIKNLSNKEIKFDDNKVGFKNFDMTIEIANFNKILNKFKDVERILSSRNKAERDEKLVLQTAIAGFQKRLAKKIITAVGSSKFGINKSEFEGIVLDSVKGKLIKITSAKFKSFKKLKK